MTLMEQNLSVALKHGCLIMTVRRRTNLCWQCLRNFANTQMTVGTKPPPGASVVIICSADKLVPVSLLASRHRVQPLLQTSPFPRNASLLMTTTLPDCKMNCNSGKQAWKQTRRVRRAQLTSGSDVNKRSQWENRRCCWFKDAAASH